jgi:hypothetical protein
MKVTVETVMDLILVNLLMRMATFVVMNSQVKRMSTVKRTLTIADLEPVTRVNVVLHLLALMQMKITAIVQHATHNSTTMEIWDNTVRIMKVTVVIITIKTNY